MSVRTKRVVIAATAAVAVVLAADAADAGRRHRRRPVTFGSFIMPLGTQGLAGAGANIAIGFTLQDSPRARDANVEVQYAVDSNRDGSISEDEWRPAIEDRLDPRSSRADTAPYYFASGSESPVPNVWVWDSLADLGRGKFSSEEYLLTPQGRRVPDPDNPGYYLYSPVSVTAPILRMRTLTPRRGHRRPARGPWVNSAFLAVDNTRAPSMTIDSIDAGDPLLVHWTAFDPDSEDLNGNGALDVSGGEDENGNGKLDIGRVGVAFDFHLVWDDEDPASMTDAQLAALLWAPCTRVAGVGDTDSLDARIDVPIPTTGDLAGVASAPAPLGRHWVFAWDPRHEVGTTWRGFILRATPFDETRAIGATVYSRTVVYEAQ